MTCDVLGQAGICKPGSLTKADEIGGWSSYEMVLRYAYWQESIDIAPPLTWSRCSYVAQKPRSQKTGVGNLTLELAERVGFEPTWGD